MERWQQCAIGPIGVWTWTLDPRPFPEIVMHARLIEELGYSALWFKEDFGRDALAAAALLLANTTELIVANGVASMYGRDPVAMRSAQRCLAEAYPDRHILGVGVSHKPHAVARGHEYASPTRTATTYLAAMRDASYISPEPDGRLMTLLAALGPRMLEVARDHADGAHTFAATPEHTRRARAILGEGPFLAPVQPVVIDSDATRARETARGYVGLLLGLENYRNSWRRLGFDEADFADGGSTALVEAVIVTGDEETAAARVQEHLDAGADHVAVQVVPRDLQTPPVDGWRRFSGTAKELSARHEDRKEQTP
jgi:probable F420-dependent oxidoreductase